MLTRRRLAASATLAAGVALVGDLSIAASAPTRSQAPGGGRSKTYVLVHGAGAGGWCWRLLTPYLIAAGHRVYTPTLTAAGERWHLLTPATGLTTHIDDVVAMLRWEDLDDVILVGHSYGGMVITGVADRALERIAQLVYLDAAHPIDGESLEDVAPDVVKFGRGTQRQVAGVEVIGTPGFEDRDPAAPLPALGDTPAQLQAWMSAHETPVALKTITEKLHMTREAAIRALPRTNINTTASNARPHTPEAWHRQEDAPRVWTVDTTHNLMITKPQETADLLLRLAAT